MATREQREAWLAEAEAARHRLLMGSKEESVTFSDGRRVTYTQTTVAQLERYIAELKRLLGRSGGYGAIGVTF